ncbi:MAG: ATP-dependent sacrificial sulfur transferase LarE [Lachnospiraceae bacterium]
MKLNEFFAEHPRVAVAFSGGVDSAYLLYAAGQYAKEVQAYYIKSDFQPQFELDDALRIARELGVQMKTIHLDVLADKYIVSNPCDRCYYCKKEIFAAIIEQAETDGFPVLLDGTNASDDADDRPGMKALHELSVLSPLRLCGLTKTEIRRLSQEAGLFTWNKPAYACLATRIPTGEQITEEKLRVTEAAENFLFSLGLNDFRVRRMGNAAKLQVSAAQIGKVIENREIIITELKRYYSAVLLDLEVRE